MASCWIVGEAGVNWNGDRAKIVALIEAAKSAGASHIKFQAFNADALIERRGITDHDTIDLLRRCELTDDDLDMIQREAGRVGIPHFYSVFDPSQIERVLSRGACALKIGNKESEWEELKGACRDAQKKTTRGTKSATEAWLRELPVWISGDGDDCNVAGSWKYPANGEEPMLRSVGNRHRGYSSHFTDYRIPAAAALRGAEYIEAHLALTHTDPEWEWSLAPTAFADMVRLIREYESWL